MLTHEQVERMAESTVGQVLANARNYAMASGEDWEVDANRIVRAVQRQLEVLLPKRKPQRDADEEFFAGTQEGLAEEA